MRKVINALAIFTLLLVAGCNTPAKSPLVNWNDRIGNYTYNLALQDLGKPVNSTTLPNSSIVADWRTASAKPGSPDTLDADAEGGYVIPRLQENPTPLDTGPTPNRYLRLTFGPDGKLTGWKKYSQYHQP